MSLSPSLVGDDSHPAIMQHRMSSVSARICADTQIAKKRKRKKEEEENMPEVTHCITGQTIVLG